MTDFRSSIRKRLFRKPSSAVPAHPRPPTSPEQLLHRPATAATTTTRPKTSASTATASTKTSRRTPESASAVGGPSPYEELEQTLPSPGPKNEDIAEPNPRPDTGEWSVKSGDIQTLESSIISFPSSAHPSREALPAGNNPVLVIQEPTPGSPPTSNTLLSREEAGVSSFEQRAQPLQLDTGPETVREQSLGAQADAAIIKALLDDDPRPPPIPARSPTERHAPVTSLTGTIETGMVLRRVWVKRPGSAATIVMIREEDLVDDAKDSILRKYANSLGRNYDSPDITVRITTRGQPGERIMSPDEPFCRTIDSYYPGGQTVDEALLIDVPPRRTPRPSPRGGHSMHNPMYYQQQQQQDDLRPHESGTDYFPQMPLVPTGQLSPMLTAASHESRQSHAAHERAMSVLTTGQVPALPSPGGTRRTLINKALRPNHPRQNTSSPTALASSVISRANRPRLESTASNDKHAAIAPAPPSLPTPPAPESGPISTTPNPPTPRVASPRPNKARKTRQKQVPDGPSLPPGLTLLDTSMPPINVLIVEDNNINMKLLEQFVRRLGVRWQTAVNGREAVQKWRLGGFHLVLMDIQLPIMSGLEATREIRRLERVNNIGVFSSSSSASDAAPEADLAPDQDQPAAVVKNEDRLGDVQRLFKSPVIIVALTASNLQSDRHEALAAGCNDFLTKVCLSWSLYT
jgi:osomolarity two-component system response regulator SSK1